MKTMWGKSIKILVSLCMALGIVAFVSLVTSSDSFAKEPAGIHQGVVLQPGESVSINDIPSAEGIVLEPGEVYSLAN